MSSDSVEERLARIETKIDRIAEDRKRLDAVEKKLWLHTGGLAVLVFLLDKIGLPIKWS